MTVIRMRCSCLSSSVYAMVSEKYLEPEFPRPTNTSKCSGLSTLKRTNFFEHETVTRAPRTGHRATSDAKERWVALRWRPLNTNKEKPFRVGGHEPLIIKTCPRRERARVRRRQHGVRENLTGWPTSEVNVNLTLELCSKAGTCTPIYDISPYVT